MSLYDLLSPSVRPLYFALQHYYKWKSRLDAVDVQLDGESTEADRVGGHAAAEAERLFKDWMRKLILRSAVHLRIDYARCNQERP